MADKMREIFGDDSDSDDQENDSKSQDEEEEEEEEEENDAGEHEDNNQNGEESDNEVQEVHNESQEEEEEEEVEHNEDDENQDNNSSVVDENDNTQTKQDTEVEEDDENSKQDNQAVEAVFGDELADLSEDSDIDTDNLSRSNNKTQITDDAEEAEQEAEQIINVEVPRIKSNFGKEMHFVKLPNFLSVEAKPFDPETYEDETTHTDALDEEGKTRVKLKVENTIRWRNSVDENGDVVKESNARFVRWSDGSLSLHLGNEIFDVYKQYMQGDHNHLFIRQGTGLQGQAVFKTKLAFRPHSTDSLTHRKMTMSLVDSGAKTQKVKILTDVIKNPDAQRSEMIKKEEEKLRAASRRENQLRRLREKSHSKGLSTQYLEDKYSEEDESAISLSAIKSKFKSGGRNDSRNSINSSGDESDRERRLNKAKSSYDDDDSDNDRNQTKKKKKIVADDDE